jgi:hypothetical protein
MLSADLAEVPDQIDLRNPAAAYHCASETVDLVSAVHAKAIFQQGLCPSQHAVLSEKWR